MNRFLTKKTAALAVLLVAAGSAYAATCTQCYCINWGGVRVCFCSICQEPSPEPGQEN